MTNVQTPGQKGKREMLSHLIPWTTELTVLNLTSTLYHFDFGKLHLF